MEDKSKEQLLMEIDELRQSIAELEGKEAEGKKAGEALRKSEERYRILVKTIVHGIQEIDTLGTITFVSDAYCRLMGYEEGDLLGKTIWDFIEFETASKKEELQKYLELLVKNQPFPTPYFQRNRRKDGRVIHIQVDWNYKRNSQGLVTGFISVLTDITERRKAEEVLQKTHEELEIRVKERTVELLEANERLQLEVDERKQAEKALRDAKDFSDNLIDSMQDGFSVLDPQGVHIDVNLALCQMSGFSREELIGVGPPHPYWPPEAYEEIESAFQKTLRGEFDSFELTFMRKNGERFPVIVSPSQVEDSEGDVVSYFATIKDITRRKQAEEALRESEKRYRTISELSTDYIFSLRPDSSGQFLTEWLTDGITRITGYTEDEIPSTVNWAQVIHPEDRWTLQDNIKAWSLGKSTTREVRVITKKGETRWVRIHTQPQLDAQGHIVRIIGAGRDITERKQAEEALRESEEKLRILFDSTHDLISLTDVNAKTLWANPAWKEVFGDDLEGREDPFKLIHPEDIKKTATSWQTLVEGDGEIRNLEYRFKDNRGEYMAFESSAQKVMVGGETLIFVIAHDITGRKQMEQELEEQRIKAVQADRLHALGGMAAGVAHELNQPLAAISTTAEGICLRHQAGIEVSSEQVTQQMGDVLKLVDRMSEIINHMRVFARDTSEVGSLPFRISEAIQNTLKFVQAQLKVHGIAVHVDIADDLPECRGWPNEIEQVLLNLISNARDVMDARGEKMKTGELPSDPGWQPVLGIQVRLGPDGGFLRIEVSDTGGGIPEDTLPRIFDPFFTTKEVGQGTGLGLSIAQGIVEKHGGRLEVGNRPGDGVTFSVVLPVAVRNCRKARWPIEGDKPLC